MAEISNEVLAVLVIVAMAISLAGTFTTLSLIRQPMPITGFQVFDYGITNVSIGREANIELLVQVVDFHDMELYASNETSNYDPHPFVINNNGTVFLNVSVKSEHLWPVSEPNPSGYYRVNATDNNETPSISAIQNGWVGPDPIEMMPNTTALTIVTCLNNTDLTDTVNIQINITVPGDAVSGVHTAWVTFTGADAGPGVCGPGL